MSDVVVDGTRRLSRMLAGGGNGSRFVGRGDAGEGGRGAVRELVTRNDGGKRLA